MPQEVTLHPAGLFTDPGGDEVPPGALRQAKGVCIRRKGIIEPQPGFYVGASHGTAGREIFRGAPYDGDIALLFDDGDIGWYSDYTHEILDEDSANPTVIDENFRGVQARDNLYLPFADGIRKVTASDDQLGEIAGIPCPGSMLYVLENAAGTAVANGKVVRYRVLVKRVDANGLELRSVPSNALVYDNDSGGTTDPQVGVYFTKYIAAGDILEFYRSAEFTSGTVPDEELQLAYEYTVTSADIAAGYMAFDDSTPPDELGSTIYTAPSREGRLQENARPPKAYDLAVFKRSMFYSRAYAPQRVTLTFKQASDNNQSTDNDGVGARIATGDITTGSPSIANVAPLNGVEIGQELSATGIPANSYITDITGTTVTISANATATAVGRSLSIFDVVIVGTATDYTAFRTYGLCSGVAQRINRYYTGLYAYAYQGGTGAPDELIGRALADEPETLFSGEKGSVVIETHHRGTSQFYVWATHGDDAFEPVVGQPTYSSGLVLSTDTGKASSAQYSDIVWSKADQPEHVPETNRAKIGSSAHPVMRMIPTKDAMYIFKRDGIWRLTGSGEESGWRIDEFDLSTRLLRPDCAVEMFGSVYAWTNRGLVRITDAGIDMISEPAIGSTLNAIERDLDSDTTATWGAWLSKNEKDNEIILAVPGDVGDDLPTSYYVFNIKTSAWYEWAFYFRESAGGPPNTNTPMYPGHIITNPTDNLIYYFVVPDETNTRTFIETTKAGVEWYQAVTLSSIDGTAVVTSSYPWNVGDMISRAGNTWIVTAVTDNTHITVDSSGLATGSTYAYFARPVTIEWEGKTGGNPGIRKHFLRGAYLFDAFDDTTQLTLGASSDMTRTPTTYDETYTRTTDGRPRTVRFAIPSAHARSTEVYPYLSLAQAGGEWELSGLSLWFVPTDERGLRI